MERRYTANGQDVRLMPDPTVVAVRFRESAPMSMRHELALQHDLGPFHERRELAREKYTIFPVRDVGDHSDQGLETKLGALNAQPEVARATPVYKYGNKKVVATDRVLVGFKAGTNSAAATLKRRGLEIVHQNGDEYVVRLGEYDDPFDVSAQLAKDASVAYAEPDFVVMSPRTTLPSAALQPSANAPAQYALKITGADAAQQLHAGAQDVRIAIIDEGVDTTHVDLGPAIVGSYDATDDDEFQEPQPNDAHGTACAGLAAGKPSTANGVRGIGSGCSLLAVRIAYGGPDGNWVTSNSWIARAIEWAWKHDAAVLSNSWGGGIPSTAITNAFVRARTQGRGGKGSVVVIAAGNDNAAVDFPGNIGDVLTVSASNEYDEPKTPQSQDGETWWGSCFGPQVSVAAPGVHNYTSDITGPRGYNPAQSPAGDYIPNFNGTSSATPIVAGAAALVISANPALSEADVRSILCKTAAKAGSLPYVGGRNDHMGFGRVDALAAVKAAIAQAKPADAPPS